MIGKRLTVWLGVCLTATLIGGCSADGGTSSSTGEVLPVTQDGLLLLDCWNDTFSVIDVAKATLGESYEINAPTPDGVTVEPGCSFGLSGNGGVTEFSPDRTKVTASKSSDDGSRYVGYVEVATGKFTDMSARLKLDANGNFTDEGSGADDFAGPINDRTVGFGPDGTYYLSRANRVFGATAPAYDEYADTPEDFQVPARLGADGPGAVTVWTGDAPAVEIPKGTAEVPAYNPEYPSDLDPGFAPLLLDEKDNQSGDLRCDVVRWVNDKALLCLSSSSPPWIIDLNAAKLTVATEYAGVDSCSDCYGAQYVWVLPAGAARALVPKTQRQLSGFVVAADGQSVLFLGSAGEDQAILYSVKLARGSTPAKLGTLELGEDAAPSFTYLSLVLRS